MVIIYKLLGGIAVSGVISIGSYGIYEISKPSTISDKLKEEKIRSLDTAENKDEEAWKSKVKEWSKDQGASKFVDKTPDPTDESNRISALKEKCQKTLMEVFEIKKYEAFKSYCSEAKSNISSNLQITSKITLFIPNFLQKSIYSEKKLSFQ